MVLFKGPVISQASGSIAGITFSRNKGGAYMRARVRGTNPSSLGQVAARSRLSQFASGFAVLSDAQRASWDQFAEEGNFVNALGDPITPPGISLYIAANSLLLQAGLSAVVSAPIGSTRPTLTFTEGATALYDTATPDLAFTGVTAVNATGGTVLVQCSPPLTAGQRSTRQRYRALIRGPVSTLPTLLVPFANRYELEGSQEIQLRLRVVRPDGSFSEPYFLRAETA